jgi:hypothetical protein
MPDDESEWEEIVPEDDGAQDRDDVGHHDDADVS